TVHINEDQDVGGLRIHKITSNAEAGGIPVLRKYAYHIPGSAAVSSGKSLYEFSNIYLFRETNPTGILEEGGRTNDYKMCIYNAQTSASIASLSTVNGGNITYDYVTEYLDEGANNGYTVHQFDNLGFVPVIMAYPFTPTIPNHWLN